MSAYLISAGLGALGFALACGIGALALILIGKLLA